MAEGFARFIEHMPKWQLYIFQQWLPALPLFYLPRLQTGDFFGVGSYLDGILAVYHLMVCSLAHIQSQTAMKVLEKR